MWALDHKEGWALKNWWFWTVVLEKTLESPLDCKESQPVHPKGNQPWLFIRWTGAEAEASILWPPDAKSQFIGKEPDAGKGWRQEEKGTIEDKMVGWHHWLNGHEFEQTPGDGEGQESLACYSPWGCKKSDRTKWLNNNSVILCLAFWKTARLFSTVAPLFVQFHQYWLRSLFLHIRTNTCPFFFVLFMATLYHSEVISYHGFYLHFLLSKDGEYLLMCWLTFVYVFSWTMSIQMLGLFCNWLAFYY